MQFIRDVLLSYPLSWLLLAVAVVALVLGVWEIKRGADLLGVGIILATTTCATVAGVVARGGRAT